jgi:hypothetical protein
LPLTWSTSVRANGSTNRSIPLVPEQVSYAFSRGGRNLQRIGTPGAGEATQDTWERIAT